MGGEDDNGILVADVRQDITESDSLLRVQPGGRLVHDNHFRVADDGLCNPKSSFHTPG